MNKILKITVLVIWLLACKDASKGEGVGAANGKSSVKEKISLSYIVTFSIGKSSVDGKPIKSGDIISGEPKFVVPASSQLDIQIKGLQSDVSLRIKSGTNVNFYSRKKENNTEFVSFIKKGEVLYSIGKLSKGEGFITLTPLTHNEVRGTQFKVSVKEDGTSSVKVGEGAVATSYSTPTLEALSESDKIAERGRQEINDVIGRSKVIEAGKEVTVNKKEVDVALDDPELKALLDNPTLKKVDDPTALPKDEALEAHLAEYEKKYAANTNAEAIAKKPEENLQIKDSKESEAIKKESKQIVVIVINDKNNDAEIKKAVDEHIKKNSGELTKTVENVFGKGSETLNLTNGTKVRGVIIQQSGNYIVHTPEGEKVFSDSQVQGFSF